MHKTLAPSVHTAGMSVTKFDGQPTTQQFNAFLSWHGTLKLVGKPKLQYLGPSACTLINIYTYIFWFAQSHRRPFVERKTEVFVFLWARLYIQSYVIVLCLDFSKAFDTVRNSTLMEKLAQLDMPDNAYNWMVDFFNGHSHRTKYEGQTSSLHKITAI